MREGKDLEAELYCWGYNYFHQVGTSPSEINEECKAKELPTISLDNPAGPAGNFVQAPRRVDVRSLVGDSRIEKVAAGLHHSLALTNKGEVIFLGTDFAGIAPLPVKLSFKGYRFGLEIAILSCGNKHSACISTSGILFTWGCGFFGRLGHGDESSFNHPKPVERPWQKQGGAPLKDRWALVDCGGSHTACTTEKGDVFLWGFNKYGQCGQNPPYNVLRPMKLHLGPIGEKALKARVVLGRFHSMIWTAQGEVFSWGHAGQGRLGHGYGSMKMVVYPKALHTFRDASRKVKLLAAGEAHNLAVTEDNQVYSWGNGEDGQLGLGNYLHSRLPRQILHLQTENITQIACGKACSMAVTSRDVLYTWGIKGGGGGFSYNTGFQDATPKDTFAETCCKPMEVLLPRNPDREYFVSQNDKILSLAAGGAHSVVVAERVPHPKKDWHGRVVSNNNKVEAKVCEDQDPDISSEDDSDTEEEALMSSDSDSVLSDSDKKNKFTKVRGRRLRTEDSDGSTVSGGSSIFTQDMADLVELAFSYCRNDRYAELQNVMEKGYLISARDEKGNTLLLCAAQNNNKRVAKLCLRNAAEINVQNHRGQTVLHYCYKYGFQELFEFFLDQGADDTLTNKDGLTCFEGLSLEDLADFEDDLGYTI